MKHFILGGNSFLGNAYFKYLKQKNCEVKGSTSKNSKEFIKFNLNESLSINDFNLKPDDIVYFVASISSPDTCTKEFEYAWTINVKNTSSVISNLLDEGIKVIFFSSDTVYGEQNSPFSENVPCNPLGEYALMKHKVEDKFRKNNNFKALRLSYVFSRNDKFTNYIVDMHRQDKVVEVFHPMKRSVIYLSDLLEGLFNLSNSWDNFNFTFINFGGNANISRYEFTNTIKNLVFKDLKITKKIPPESFFKSRAKIINMESNILSKILGRSLTNFPEAVKKEFRI